MQITVVDENMETIFEGDADDYLFDNDNDTDLEILLNDLESKKDYASITTYNLDGEEITITKQPLIVE